MVTEDDVFAIFTCPILIFTPGREEKAIDESQLTAP